MYTVGLIVSNKFCKHWSILLVMN